MTMQWIRKTSRMLPAASLLVAMSLPAAAQNYDHRRGDFYNGAYQGGRGGGYDRRDRRDYRDDGYYQQQNRGGIGPGKGAAIGAAGGAALGAIFGGGLKGAIIGGAAGAGVGAIAGQAHKDNQRNYYNGRPY